MELNIDNVRRVFDKLQSMGFWERLLNWKSIRLAVSSAAAEYEKLVMELAMTRENAGKMEIKVNEFYKDVKSSQEKINELTTELEGYRQKNQDQAKTILEFTKAIATKDQIMETDRSRIGELNSTQAGLKKELDLKNTELEKLRIENIGFSSAEERRKKEHSEHVATLAKIKDDIVADRKTEKELMFNTELARINNLKFTWSNHEQDVKQQIRSLCQKHTIEYVEKVPFKGEPDNTVFISEEFIIFDAKSPRGEDLDSFPKYLKAQTELARKYASMENVKKWLFFVVPSNTLECIDCFCYNLSDFTVFIISKDSLEPVLLSLKRLEDYEFAEQLSPEDRETVCRVLGKFAHLAKRRIQIDTFFIKQFMDLAFKAETELPAEILEKSIDFEKAERLNPPIEKRSKRIDTSELQRETFKVINETKNRGLPALGPAISDSLNNSPLYTENSDLADENPNENI